MDGQNQHASMRILKRFLRIEIAKKASNCMTNREVELPL
jgi:hypothetical protein